MRTIDIGCGAGLVSNRRYAIIWNDDGLGYWLIDVYVGQAITGPINGLPDLRQVILGPNPGLSFIIRTNKLHCNFNQKLNHVNAI